MDKKSEQKLRRRNERRLSRIARWDRPLHGWSDRLGAWINMLFVDHGIFRVFYLNAHSVGGGNLWRSAQPTPNQLRGFHRKGVRSVVCLRGQREYGSWPLEKETCADLGIALHEIRIRSREAPERSEILELKRIFEAIEYPALIHCKSGADRAGLVAALFLLFRENAPASDAIRQLSWKYGHIRSAKTGILHDVIKSYMTHSQTHPISFEDWVASEYDPKTITESRKTWSAARFVTDKILRRE
ncbi:fused DSP-PTPase phosphatase/NAD kinase-like protein [Methylorubrum suomiense]|uniref:Tyrosine specific protein phosphatases domain-containing protein n=1 Tax=Methylorubrum suomiense TaxID=144191 RepID=A0ABQ4URB8_9HYPH|nr:tyrosine-protein phosphatase [Methylorubrum suomiense]GJE74787.1 hypothetical protein BGCPKDLD_1360 [Methylorubrum suomiense]